MSSAHTHEAEVVDEVEQRRREVAVRLASRIPYAEIARQLGVSKSTVGTDVQAIRKGWQQHYADEYHVHASEQLAALDLVKQRLLPRVLSGGKPRDDGTTTMDLFALDRLLGVMDREARLLGLDAPQRIEVQMHVEIIAKAIEHVVIELGMDPEAVRPALGAKLRELGAISEHRNGN